MIGCIQTKNLIQFPNYISQTTYDFKSNPLTQAKIDLGRRLFFDPILSRDSSISCASCHSPFNGFGHSDHDLSHGIGDSIGHRNAPALFNLAWQKSFMWDGAVHHLDIQALAPISHPREMGASIGEVIQKLNRSKIYKQQFQLAFGDTINSSHILKALSQFQLTLISLNSKYDSVKKGNSNFTSKEMNGYNLFKKHCNSCHSEPLFSNYEFKNNGLPIDETLNDIGRVKISQIPHDSFHFKTPSLRNLSYTFPYMHDGRFKNLHQVLKHYTFGVYNYSNLSPELRSKIELTENERIDLIAFLLTLNDPSFHHNSKFRFH